MDVNTLYTLFGVGVAIVTILGFIWKTMEHFVEILVKPNEVKIVQLSSFMEENTKLLKEISEHIQSLDRALEVLKEHYAGEYALMQNKLDAAHTRIDSLEAAYSNLIVFCKKNIPIEDTDLEKVLIHKANYRGG